MPAEPTQHDGRVRAGRPCDVDAMRSIEVAAGARFAEVGLPEIADDEPLEVAVLEAHVADGTCWVAEVDGEPVGYALAHELEDAAHVDQVSVLPTHQGEGWGRALLVAVEHWASSRGLAALTLTTFDDVPWNRPLYEHLGFRVLAARELTPALQQVVEHEAAEGLDPAMRVVMRRDVWSASD